MNLVKDGVAAPIKRTCSALHDAAFTSGLFLVTEIPEKNAPAGGRGDAHGHPCFECRSLSRRPGKRLAWDSAALKVTNNEDANKFIKRAKYRAGWEYSAAKV